MQEVGWLLENRIVFTRSVGKTVAEEMKAFDATLVTYLDGQDQPIHIVTDSRQAVGAPPMTDVLKLQYLKHENLGWSVVIGKSNMAQKLLGSTVGPMLKLRYLFVEDPTRALEVLRSADPSLPDMDMERLLAQLDLQQIA